MESMPPREFQRPYERIADDLRGRIRAGEWGHGDALPPVTELAAHYSASRTTVSHAITVLAGEGLVQTVPRWGTFVV